MSGGQWTLHYDWGCTGTYFQAKMDLSGDGTLSLPPYRTARWVEHDGKIMWRLDNSPTVYSGDRIGSSMAGIMSTFQGRDGCWYATIGYAPPVEFDARKPEVDVAGNTTSVTSA